MSLGIVNSNHSQPSIAVIGLGYVGLPLALSYAKKGCIVYGVDIDSALVSNINQASTPLHEQDGEQTIQDILEEQLEQNHFRAYSNLSSIPSDISTYIVTVGIPIVRNQPIYTYFDSVFESLRARVKPGDLIIIRSTVVPGTTMERVVPMLEQTGLELDKDLFLAYCSERIAEGRAFEEHRTMPLVLGGIGEASTQRAKEILQLINEAPIHVADIQVVEASKVIENIQRDVNLALAQEIASYCQATQIDTMELIRIANTHARVQLLIPGPGVGGYCIPNAFYYLQAKANEVGVETPLLRESRSVNEKTPYKVINRVYKALQENGKLLQGSKVAVLGLAMKDYSSDPRLSPAIEIIHELVDQGSNVYAYDPNVYYTSDRFNNQNDVLHCIEGADALLILTLQSSFLELDFKSLLPEMNPGSVIFDAKRIIDPALCDALDITLLRI